MNAVFKIQSRSCSTTILKVKRETSSISTVITSTISTTSAENKKNKNSPKYVNCNQLFLSLRASSIWLRLRWVKTLLNSSSNFRKWTKNYNMSSKVTAHIFRQTQKRNNQIIHATHPPLIPLIFHNPQIPRSKITSQLIDNIHNKSILHWYKRISSRQLKQISNRSQG